MAEETKIVKATPKTKDTQAGDQPRVTVKAAVIPNRPVKQAPAKTPVAQQTTEAPARRLPMGRPVVNKDLESRGSRIPAGLKVVPKDVSNPKKAEPVPEVKEEVKVETPKEEVKVEAPKKEEPKTEEVKVEAPKVEAPKAEAPKKEEKPAAKPQKQEQKREGAKGDYKPYKGEGQGRDGKFQGKSDDRRNQSGDKGYKRDPKTGTRYQTADSGDKKGGKPFQKRDGAKGGEGLQRMETKHGAKDQQKRSFVERDHNKFDKFENRGQAGKKNKDGIDQRSLEKAAKPKKHSQYKQEVVVEEDIMESMPTGTIAVTCPITVGGFCEQADITLNTVIMTLMKMGIMANINQSLDADTVEILAAELGISVLVTKEEKVEVEEGIEDFEDKEEDLKPRAPFVTVMGHVDHGKTSLLDAIRQTNVATGEAGGITQHIGASEVTINGKKIVFLDTPGHEAFTAMRARGAHVTDIAVLVVAADDGVMPQTIESISHAKAAGVPIIVAINKIDKPAANPDRVKQELTEHGILVEDWGGDTIAVPVSAKKGTGITELLEMILLQAEVLELKANPNRMAKGSVVEARLDKDKGPVATLLVDNGTLRAGQSVVVGNCYGRIRLMTDFRGKEIAKAGPATAVEILGLDGVPEAGDEFNAVKDDKTARKIAENRKMKLREEILARNASSTLEKLFSQIQEGEVKDLNLIVKGDVQGSIEAIVASLEKLNNENVRVKVVHTGVGTINESDVMLASTTGSIIIGFNVRPTTAVQTYADSENVQIRLYRVIYDIINEIEDAMKGMLDPEFKEEVLGKIEVRDTFKVPNVGIIAGAYVVEGKAVRNAEVRLVRDGIVIHEGKISSLKRFKDDAKEVLTGFECGIGIENYNDIKVGDIIECFQMVEVERK